MPILDFKATILNQSGTRISNVKVLIKTVNDSVTTSGYGYTDTTGSITGTLPANKPLQLIVYNKCGTVSYTQNIGPFASGPVNLGIVTVTVSPQSTVTFSGTVINCTGTPVTNGYVDIVIDEARYFANITNGSFALPVVRCINSNTTANVTAYDVANNVQGTARSVAVTGPTVATGQLTACGMSTNQYINYTLEGNSYSYVAPADSIISTNSSIANAYAIWFLRRQSADHIYLSFGATATGSTPIVSLAVNSNSGASYHLRTAATINITEYGAVGEYMGGNFTATVAKDSTNTTYPITATFRVKRTY